MQARRVLLAAIALATCTSMSVMASSLSDIAEAVSEDVGVVLEVTEGDPDRVIFVFEEQHDSILVQIEIAIMLDRLYTDHGMRQIGLESLAVTEGPLDLSWAHTPPPYRPDQPITTREDVIAHTLFQGEIGAVEMMGLIYEDAVVNGIDDAELLAIDIPLDTWWAPLSYVYNIALAGMKDTEFERWEALYDAEKYEEAMDYAIATDPFAQEAYDRMNDTVNMASNEETLEIFALLRSRVRRERVNLPEGAEADLEACEDFLMAASERSDIMAASALELASAHPGMPVAINIGAMHTERIIQLLDDAGVSYVLIRTKAQATGSLAGLLTYEQYERKSQGLSIGGENHIGAFLDGRKKPAPVCTTWWYEAEVAQLNVLSCMAFVLEKDLNEGHTAEEGWPEYLDGKANGLLKDYLSEGYITSFKTMGVGADTKDGYKWPFFTAEITVVNPETGEETKVIAEVSRPVGTSYTVDVTLTELLEQEHATLVEATSPEPSATSGGQPAPVKACSNTTVSWKGA